MRSTRRALSAAAERRLIVCRLHKNMISSPLQHPQVRFQTTTSAVGDKLRVAVVGGNVAGLSAALHLAPLVEQGLVAAPIDVFDAPPQNDKKKGRDIGVGLWTTAIEPLVSSESQDKSTHQRTSHEQVFDALVHQHSTMLNEVGYRTPDGAWLMRSALPTTWEQVQERQMPGLLFLRERDLVGTLERAVAWEEQRGVLQVHRAIDTNVLGVVSEENGQLQQPWSGRLELGGKPKRRITTTTTTTVTEEESSPTDNIATRTSDRDYHLIVAADGTHSNLRRRYGGLDSMLGSSAAAPLASPSLDGAEVVLNNSNHNNASGWNDLNHQQAVGLQDRNYTVFRGNAPITAQQLAALDPGSADGRISFQTWGTHNSMRFATVPMHTKQQNGQNGSTLEQQVWFITVNDKTLHDEVDPVRRRDRLLEEHFHDWHSPIADIVQATDPNTILMERAIAHRHVMGPILNMNRVLQRINNNGNSQPNSSSDLIGGPGPAVVFLGDAYMTIDPILAQGFTVAMEGSANLYQSVRRALTAPNGSNPSPLAFDPYALRDELVLRHEARMGRLICLLRATELVQALGQPEGGSVLGGLNTHMLRPLTRLCPNFAKRPLFDAVLKYSLGL